MSNFYLETLTHTVPRLKFIVAFNYFIALGINLGKISVKNTLKM